jgi:hypothetical protein
MELLPCLADRVPDDIHQRWLPVPPTRLGARSTYQPYAAHTTVQVRATHLQSGTADCCLTATAVVLGSDAE